MSFGRSGDLWLLLCSEEVIPIKRRTLEQLRNYVWPGCSNAEIANHTRRQVEMQGIRITCCLCRSGRVGVVL